MKYSEAFAILKELGAGEFAHLNGDLEAHLIGTHDLLRDWGNTEYVCAAASIMRYMEPTGYNQDSSNCVTAREFLRSLDESPKNLCIFMPRATESMCTHR